MVKIFISYRREDSEYQTDRLHAELSKYVESPERDIFIDVDSIPLGVDFAEYLDQKVSQCEALVAVIGKRWLEATDPTTGERRLNDPHDFVRIEIASALQRGIPVVPLLLDGTEVPDIDRLPDNLKLLARKNGTRIDRKSFSADVQALIKGLPISLGSEASDAATQPPIEPEPENEQLKQKTEAAIKTETETEIDWEGRVGEPDPHGRKFSDILVVHSEGDDYEAFSIFQCLSAKDFSVSTFPIGIDPDYDNQAWVSVPEAKLVIVIWSRRALTENRTMMCAIADKAAQKLINTCTVDLPWDDLPSAFKDDIHGVGDLHLIEKIVSDELGAEQSR